MDIIPAIDLKGGKCVRLFQGRRDRGTVFSDRPWEIAQRWEDEGARRLHVVDLDGAFFGKPVHEREIERIVTSVGIPVQVGGGMRNLDAMERYFSMGVGRIVLGTMAQRFPDFVRQACSRFPSKVMVSIDARNGKVAVEGWKETTSIEVIPLAQRLEGNGISAIVYTDIGRDGTERGVNLSQTRKLAESVDISVIAAGGISHLRDIEALLKMEHLGVIGVIIGKALYSGGILLREALALSRGEGTTENSGFP
ncbi:MAG: 1-(5-phosphoribosyl)-5-[(5-phosphoribosylamino)methylideneamino]imidazole-4-carboxamide isomerase [Syntrophobacterales bacterium]|nr:MAG: 1-(5-phosphoribosyl)-5-[(5-phosphoribosylamino)methylideneamino]imidazole-4-carboxamide isomerase [Syntrophobacterales bacterium]